MNELATNPAVNNAAIVEFESGGMYAPRGVGIEMAVSREAQEVQVAMIAAKRMPRDPVQSYNRIIQDCKRPSLANRAVYSYPRGNTNVTGPSIHLARVLARAYGNLDSGFKVLDATETKSTVMAYCWDLETNYRESKVFDVPNIRKTKSGSYPLTDPRDIYENIANQAARRERSCILAVIPADFVDAALGQCEATLAGKSDVPITDRIRRMVEMFSPYGVTVEMMEKYLGKKQEAFSINDVRSLGGVFNAIKDGELEPEKVFDMRLESGSDESTGTPPDTTKRRGKKTQTAEPSAQEADMQEPASRPTTLDDLR